MSIRMVIHTRSPLVISERKPGGQFHQSYGYLPGTILRGGLAQTMIDAGGKELLLFERLFLVSTPAIFTNAYPVNKAEQEPRVIPATAASCKSFPGFYAQERRGDRDRKDGVFDTLIERVCCELLQPSALVYSPHCCQDNCGSPVDHFDGFYVTVGRGYHKTEVHQRLLTRVALNRRRGVAEDGLLYWPSALVEARPKEDARPEQEPYEDNLFVGYLLADLDEAMTQEVLSWLARLTRLGGGSSRGLGAVHIEAKVTTEQEEVGAIQKRVKEFNDRLTGRWQVYQELRPQTKPQWAPVEGQGHFFAITLQSDAILKRPDGRPTIILDGEILERATRPPEKCVEPGTGFQAQLIRSFAGYDYRGGWNTAWGLPKNTEVIARMGSVYLFWTESMDYDALIRLEREGVGEGRAAGFGRVRVCDEFHTILWEGAK